MNGMHAKVRNMAMAIMHIVCSFTVYRSPESLNISR